MSKLMTLIIVSAVALAASSTNAAPAPHPEFRDAIDRHFPTEQWADVQRSEGQPRPRPPVHSSASVSVAVRDGDRAPRPAKICVRRSH